MKQKYLLEKEREELTQLYKRACNVQKYEHPTLCLIVKD